MTLAFSHPWARAALSKAGVGGGYFAATNTGAASDRLVSASSPAAEAVEIHALKVVGSGLRMRPIERGVVIPAGGTITLKPRGYHLLMTGLKTPLERGARVAVTLVFEHAGPQPLELIVEEPGPVGEETLAAS